MTAPASEPPRRLEHFPVRLRVLPPLDTTPTPVPAPKLARHPDDGFVLADPYPLRASTRRSFRGLIRALLPPPPAPSPADIVDRVERHVRLHMAYMHWTAAAGLALAMILLDWLPVFTLKSARRLCSLPRERAARLLTAFGRSRLMILRTLVLGVRGSVLSAYFDQSEVHAALGYEPVPFLRDRFVARQAVLGARS